MELNRFRVLTCLRWVYLSVGIFFMGLVSAGGGETQLAIHDRVCRIHFGPVRPNVIGHPRTPLYGLTPEQLADAVADAGLELWFMPMAWGQKGVFFPSEYVAQHTEIPQDMLPRMFKRAHERGVLVAAGDQMSEVECRDINGAMDQWVLHPIDDGNAPQPDPGVISYSAAPYREWKGQFLAEAVRKLGLDGFFFDAAAYANGLYRNQAGDVGPHGQQAYREATGRPVPATVDLHDRAFQEWVNWRYDHTMAFFDSVADAAATENPDVALFINYYYARWVYGHPLRPVPEDSHWYPSLEAESSFKCKLARAISPRAEVWTWAEWFVPEVVHGRFPYFHADRSIAKGLRIIAHGLAPCFGGWSADFELMQTSLKTMFDEFKARRDYRTVDTVKHTGLLVSQQTRDFHPSTNFWTIVDGIHEIHNDRHILTDVLLDNALSPEGLAPYPVVILADAACLSDAQCDTLRSYVEDGGHLVATMQTSLCNEWGENRENFALADLFGVDYHGHFDEAGKALVPRTAEAKQQFGRFTGVVAPSVDIRIRDGAGVELLWTFSYRETMNGLSVKFEKYDSDRPAIVRRRAGKGSVTFLAFDMGLGYIKYKLPQLADLFAGLVTESVSPPVVFDAPNALEVTAFQDGPGRMFVHLVNCSALNFNEVAPLADIGVTLHRGVLTRASLPVTGATPQVDGNHVSLPAVGHGEVLVLEYE
jgi:hypothetical protein